ncbi:MAG: hypothetical protein HON32_02730 [Francisellaceae bacterium]|nr:hypothetical protein [Francisellaceae bacterium]MBT6538701.1 hypothetical protein [Francisellaceae bacterium]
MPISVNTYFSNTSFADRLINRSTSLYSLQIKNTENIYSKYNLASSKLLASTATAIRQNLFSKSSSTSAYDISNAILSAEYAGKVRSSTAVQRNISDGANLSYFAEQALSGVQTSLSRARELALQASNGTLHSSDRSAIISEFNQIKESVDQSIAGSNFNGIGLLNGDSSNLYIQAGIDPNSPLAININDMSGALDDIDLSSAESAAISIATIDASIADISLEQTNIGAISNRFGSAYNAASATTVSFQGAENIVNDASMASKIAIFTKNNMLLQAQVADFKKSNQINSSTFNIII